MKDQLGTYRDEQDIKNVILNMAQKKNQVVYGQQAVNIQVPHPYKRKTKDYDIYTKQPEKAAKETAEILNKEFKTQKYRVEKGVHKGTYKVKFDKKVIADYTGTTKKPTSKKVLGVSYANLKYQKGRLKNILKQKELEYRHLKAIDTLNKINKSEMNEFIYS